MPVAAKLLTGSENVSGLENVGPTDLIYQHSKFGDHRMPHASARVEKSSYACLSRFHFQCF